MTSVVASSPIAGFPAENALLFSDNMITEPFAKNGKQIQGRYDYTLASSSFVYATVLVGDPANDFKNTKDWYITAGSNAPLSNPSLVSYQVNADRFGLDTKILSWATQVSFIRTTNID